MFLDEARLSLRLNHPNVVQTYEVLAGRRPAARSRWSTWTGSRCTASSIGCCADRSELSLPLRLRILTSVLAGLDYAHELTDLDGSAAGASSTAT